jgi:hypothetical protein
LHTAKRSRTMSSSPSRGRRPVNGAPATCFMTALYRLGPPGLRLCFQTVLSGVPATARAVSRLLDREKRSWKTGGSRTVTSAPDLVLRRVSRLLWFSHILRKRYLLGHSILDHKRSNS